MKKNSGFTLMELMTVIGIIAILGAIATPNVIKWTKNQKINQAARELQSAIQSTRVKAIKENIDARLFFPSDTEYQIRVRQRGSAATDSYVADSSVRELPIGTTMTISAGGASFLQFGPRGTSTSPATVTVNDAAGRTLRIDIEITGTSQIS